MSAVDAFPTDVARRALDATRAHGFALAGGQALIAHGIVSRPTEDVDLFTNADGAIQAPRSLWKEGSPTPASTLASYQTQANLATSSTL